MHAFFQAVLSCIAPISTTSPSSGASLRALLPLLRQYESALFLYGMSSFAKSALVFEVFCLWIVREDVGAGDGEDAFVDA